ncbi:Reverse transcriptase zinc-binding domain [Sesbania bispinosa]|nr:Reverse transcriptase zinc-binding domain [Sesbania bispinosa]
MWMNPNQPKVLHFIWRLMHHSLPVRVNLIRRGIQCPSLCPWCSDEAETESHLLKDCSWIKDAWLKSPLGSQVPTDSTLPIGEWIDGLIETKSLEFLTLFFSPCYSFWTARNKKIFEQREVNLQLLYSKASDAVRPVDLSPSPNPVAHQNSSQSNSVWCPPPIGSFKINVDAASPGGTKWGIGIVVRDHLGEVFAAATIQISCLPNPSLAEAIGIRSAIKFALETSFAKQHWERSS